MGVLDMEGFAQEVLIGCHGCAGQMGSFFVVQGASMDRVMFGGHFVIPSASLALFNTISIIVLIPIYDRGVVPLLRRFGMKLSHLQRIGEQPQGTANPLFTIPELSYISVCSLTDEEFIAASCSFSMAL